MATQVPRGAGGCVHIPGTHRGVAEARLEGGRASGRPSWKPASGLQSGGTGVLGWIKEGSVASAGEGALWKPLTADFYLQVREESKGQSPLEDEFPNRQVGRSCHSHLLTQPQSKPRATHGVRNKWLTNQALQRPPKASLQLVLGLVAAVTFSVLILWL